jgi:endonuclease/exonuclease/phosphatase family metal-dependent hydrolase
MRVSILVCATGLLVARGQGAPVIEPTAQATAPTNAQAVMIYSAVDAQGSIITSVAVRYTVNAWQSQTSVLATQSAGMVYVGTVPGFAAGTTVHYNVSASALDGSSAGTPTNSYLVRGAVTTNINCRIMAANTTSGTQQAYEGPGIRIFQGLKPDVVGIQEFNYESGTLRQLVDTAFGTGFYYYVEPGGQSLPNGIVSRWPIVASGQWTDPYVSDRDFAWATIAIPGVVPLHVVSVHLWGSGGSSGRQSEAIVLTNKMRAQFSTNDYLALCGDFNTTSRTEPCVQTFKSTALRLSDAHVPVDKNNNYNTSEPRSNPYDWVMPNPALDLLLTTTVVQNYSYTNGLVFDTETWNSATLPSPIQSGDSHVSGMQHMPVIKDFRIPVALPLDSAPTLRGASNCIAIVGELLQLHIIASDSATQQVSLTCSDSAHFTAMPAPGTVTGVFAWTPAGADLGNHAPVFTARADGLAAQTMINISVVPEPGVLMIAGGGLLAHMVRRQRRG